MGNLNFLYDLKGLIAGGLKVGEPADKVQQKLEEIIARVKSNYIEEIYRDITSCTDYFAPEYDSWKSYLSELKNDEDYAAVLYEHYTEVTLEALWLSSHIMADMTKPEIEAAMRKEIGMLKAMEILRRYKDRVKTDAEDQMKILSKARLTGLYNLLYED